MAAVRTLELWQDRDANGTPTPTLGYDVAAWIESSLLQPDGPSAGGAFWLTPEQINFLLHWFSLDADGRFVYRRGVLRRAKGAGKTPFMAALAIAELCGPTRFGGWAGSGVARAASASAPWVNLAGVSEAQTANTMSTILAMLDGSAAADQYGLDVGLTRIYAPGGGRILPITASSATQEGARPTFAVLDETQHWTAGNGGYALARVIRRNLAKSRDGSARSLESTNAHEPGQNSVAELSYKDWLAISEKRTRGGGLLYDSREAAGAVSLTDPEGLLAGLRDAYGDATWVDLSRIRDEVYDPSTPPSEARRFYLNQVVAAEDALVAPHDWDANSDPTLTLKVGAPGSWKTGDAVTLGFDGSRRDDSTALVARRVSDGAAFLLGLWESPRGVLGADWEVDHDDVRGVIAHTFASLNVVAFFADVAEWESDVDVWRAEYGERLRIKASTNHAVAYDMRTHQADTVRANEALVRAIIDGVLPHTGDARLTRHVLNARRRPNRWGIGFGKASRESPDKVDAYAALLLATIALVRLNGSGAKVRPGRLVGFR